MSTSVGAEAVGLATAPLEGPLHPPGDGPARETAMGSRLRTDRRFAWAGTLVATLVVVALFPDVLASMVAQWRGNDTFAHGFLVAPVVGWMIWRRRTQLARVPLAPSRLGLAGLALAGLAWWLGDIAAVHPVRQFAFVAMLPAVVVAIAGLRAAAAMAFPLAYLAFAVPVGEFLLPSMMLQTADVTVAALRLTGVPVYREGLQFTLPTGEWSVVEACSGLRYVIASVTLGSLYAWLTYRSMLRRAAFIAMSLFVPVVANWARAYGIVMLGHLSDRRLAAGADHLVYGWVFFGLVMGVLFWTGARWREDEQAALHAADDDPTGAEPAAAPAASAASAAMQAGAQPLTTGIGMQAAPAAREPLAAASPLVDGIRSSAGAGCAAPSPASRRAVIVALLLAVSIPASWRAVGAWTAASENSRLDVASLADIGAPLPVGAWQPQFLHAQSRIDVRIDGPDGPVDLHASTYDRVHGRGEMVSTSNRPVGRDQHAIARLHEAVVAPDALGMPPRVSEWRLRTPEGGRLVWWWYRIDGRDITDDYAGKIATLQARLFRRGDRFAIVAVSTPVLANDDEGARLRLRVSAPMWLSRVAALDQAADAARGGR